jgi:anti-sigma B factor antagonist
MSAGGPRFFATEIVDETFFVVPSQNAGTLPNLDLANERSAFLQEIRAARIKGVVFDLAALEVFGSQMLATLCLAWKQVRDRGLGMVLCNLSETAVQVIERSKLNSLWPIYASRQLAVESLRSADAEPIRPCHTPSGSIVEGDTSRLGHLYAPVNSRLEVIELGPRTVVGFGGDDLPPEHTLGRYLNEIYELIASSGCKELTFDLAGVTLIPSGFLGVMASVMKKGVAVSVKNPSREVREVLALTNFDQLVKIQ